MALPSSDGKPIAVPGPSPEDASALDVERVFVELGSRPEGLSETEAAERLARFGANAIREVRELTAVTLFLRQLSSPLILILIAAGVLTVILREWLETGVIFAAVAVNTALGFWQEYRAESALALLKTYVRTRARVRRQNRERELDAAELVPGDVIRIEAGDRVPADGRIIFARNLEADEAVLTGESLPVAKDARPVAVKTPLPERRSMVWSGTHVTQGFGDVVAVDTGSRTEFGKIAALIASRERAPTPLQQNLARFSVRVGLLLAAFTVGIFSLGLAVGYPLFDMFLIAVAVAVSAVPEGLPMAMTVILAVGVERLARHKGIVRRLLAAETLGRTSIILTDKTGTLTEARMEVTAVVPAEPDQAASRALLASALLNTDTVIENPEDPPESWRIFGRPIEVAVVRGAARSGVFLPEVFRHTNVLDRLPFDSRRKFSVSVSAGGGRERTTILGAPEAVLGMSAPTPAERRRWEAEIERRAQAGERILGVAAKDGDGRAAEAVVTDNFYGRGFTPLDPERSGFQAPLENSFLTGQAGDERVFPSPLEKRPAPGGYLTGFIFLGLIAIRDPLRPGVREAIARIGASGVKTVIVTGDHRGTAEAVARELGILDGQFRSLTGEELSRLSGPELVRRAGAVRVFARVTPAQKLELVGLYRKQGEVVAVTGDGVNDAPALQAADIGVAVGSGTDVAKSTSDLILLDDNFETLVRAIEEGRTILVNIRKVIVYLLSDALDELMLIGGALLAGLALPLSALQILFVNFFSDSFPAIGLAFERGVDGPGKVPRELNPNLFDRTVRFLILVIGVLSSVILFVLYVALLQSGFPGELVRTFIFTVFATYTLLLTFSIRSLERSVFSYNPFSNHYLNAGVAVGFALTMAAIYAPILQEVFDTVALPPVWLAAVFGFGALNILAVEFGKWLFRRRTQ